MKAKKPRVRRVRPAPPDIDWRLCERVAALPEGACGDDEIGLLLDLLPAEQDAVLRLFEEAVFEYALQPRTIGQALVWLRFGQLSRVWHGCATVEQHHRIIHKLWGGLGEAHRRRLQIELGVGPWPHNHPDVPRVDGAVRWDRLGPE